MKKSITKTENGTIKRNLRKWYRYATQDQKLNGLRWYEDAQDHSKLIADTFDIDRYVAAQVISALSPNNKWNRNKIDAFNVVRCWKDGNDPELVKVCTYSANKAKAFDILNGKVSIEKTAPKTHSFGMNIGYLSPDHVTIDKWHIRACLCSPMNQPKVVDTITDKHYKRVEKLTVELAREYNVKGYEFQAIVWIAAREGWTYED